MTKIKKIDLPNNESYEGEMLNGEKHGKGTFTYSDGGKYIGSWKNDTRHGKGIENSDGYEYSGEYKNDLQHGYGKIVLGDGTIYEGTMEEGSPNGNGKLTNPDGSIHEGKFENGLKEGIGKMHLPDKDKEIIISGNWLKGFLHGDTEHIEDKDIKKIKYYYGEKVDTNQTDKVENKQYPIGHIYTGNIVFGVPEGNGTMQFVEGQFYQGDWEDGKPNGHGLLIDGSEVYYGEFKSWKPPNPIRMYTGKSTLVEGFYENAPRIIEWAWAKKNPYLDSILNNTEYGIIREHEIEGLWTKKLLKERLGDNFRGTIDNLNIITMNPNLEISHEEFTETFNEYCKENNRKGYFADSIYRTKSFIFDDWKEIKSGFSKMSETAKKILD